MKALDTPGLSRISRSLTNRKLGSSNVVLNGSLEMFQCAKRLNLAPQPTLNLAPQPTDNNNINPRPRAKTDDSGNIEGKVRPPIKAGKIVGSPIPTFEQFARESSPNQGNVSSGMDVEASITTSVKPPIPRLLQPPSDREAIGRARAFSLTSTATGLDGHVPQLEEVVLARSRSGTMDSVGGDVGSSGVRSRSGSAIGGKGGRRSRSMTGDSAGPPEADKLRQDFIGILNETWGDHDFSSASPHEFRLEMSKSRVIQDVNVLLAELTAGEARFLVGLWSALEDAISLSKDAVEVYKYLPDSDGDPFSEQGSVWSFNYFFFNKDLNVICYFTCVAAHNIESDASDVSPSEVEESEPPSDYYVNSEDEDAED